MLAAVSLVQPSQVLYSRYEDGARPVRVLPDGWEVLGLDGTPEGKYTTAQGLLRALTGHPKGRHWSIDRYFRLGPKHGRGRLPVADIFDIYPLIVTTPEITIPREEPVLGPKGENRTRKSSPGVVFSSRLGIDLDRRAGEVRKLLFAGFGRQMYLSGYDPEDVLQEVYKGLLVRNAGKCPWDPAKSSFGHYVHMVCGCVLSNYHRKQHRVRAVEQVGLPNSMAEDTEWQDVASNTTVPARPTTEHEAVLVREQTSDLVDFMRRSPEPSAPLAARLLPLLVAETPRSDLTRILGCSKAALSRAWTFLKEQARAWEQHPAMA